METKSSDSKTDKHFLTWNDCRELLGRYNINSRQRFYGIPRGGQYVAALTGNPVDTPEEADILIDDIIDSGATRAKWAKRVPGKPFYALINKIGHPSHAKLPWVVFPWEKDVEEGPEENIIRLLEYIGEDVNREGLQETPQRIIRSYETLFQGYRQNPADVIKTFEADGYNQIILSKNIELYSMCEHHMLPFIGHAHVAYIPRDRIVGISKLARLVDVFARRLQIQERLGDNVVDSLMEHLQPEGAACIIEAEHLCMKMRGCNKQNSVMVTSSLAGVFMEDARARSELMGLIGK